MPTSEQQNLRGFKISTTTFKTAAEVPEGSKLHSAIVEIKKAEIISQCLDCNCPGSCKTARLKSNDTPLKDNNQLSGCFKLRNMTMAK